MTGFSNMVEGGGGWVLVLRVLRSNLVIIIILIGLTRLKAPSF